MQAVLEEFGKQIKGGIGQRNEFFSAIFEEIEAVCSPSCATTALLQGLSNLHAFLQQRSHAAYHDEQAILCMLSGELAPACF